MTEPSWTAFPGARAIFCVIPLFAVLQIGIGLHFFRLSRPSWWYTRLPDLAQLGPTRTSPVIVVGMPKVGTTTISAFFECGHLKTSHWQCGRKRCGVCIRDNLARNRSVMEGCGGHEVWAQLDAAMPPKECVFPQIDFLDEISAEFPKSTFILNLRPVEKWLRSVSGWRLGGKGETMADRLFRCGFFGLSDGADRNESLIRWFNDHTERIRSFARAHPQHRLITVDIEDPGAADLLSQNFGVPASCWGHANESEGPLQDVAASGGSWHWGRACAALVFVGLALCAAAACRTQARNFTVLSGRPRVVPGHGDCR